VADPNLLQNCRTEQRELRKRLRSAARLLIALGGELPDPGELGDPAETAQRRRLLLRYLPAARDRRAEYERLLTGQASFRRQLDRVDESTGS
jgi:hypothetical protein